MGVSKLDERGFIFLGAKDGRPYLCRMWGGQPWLFYWHDADKHWVSLCSITQAEVFALPNNLTEAEQEVYRQWEQEYRESQPYEELKWKTVSE